MKHNASKFLHQPIIFIGNPRSGTSVISEIIMRHKDLAFPSQHHDRWPGNPNVNYLRLPFDNRLWRFFGQKNQLNKVSKINRLVFIPWEAYRMWKTITPSDIDFDRDFLRNIKASEESRSKIREFFQKMVSRHGKKRLAFKITGPARMEYLLSIFPNACFVRIHREPAATIRSLLKIPFWNTLGIHQLWWTGVYTAEEIKWAEKHKKDPIAITAIQLKKVEEITEKEIQENDANVLDVHYGAFVENPVATLDSILDFAGLSRDKACYNYLKINKIYNRNTDQETFFKQKDLLTIQKIFDEGTVNEPLPTKGVSSP